VHPQRLRDQPAGLGRPWAWPPASPLRSPLDGGRLRHALLAVTSCSREPLQASVCRSRGRSSARSRRAADAARRRAAPVFVAHLRLPAPVRQAQADALLRRVGDPAGPSCSRLNECPTARVRKLLAAGFRDAWAECGAQELVTAPWTARRPHHQVLLGPDLSPRRSGARSP